MRWRTSASPDASHASAIAILILRLAFIVPELDDLCGATHVEEAPPAARSRRPVAVGGLRTPVSLSPYVTAELVADSSGGRVTAG
jgi:hypothetical protein